MSVTSSPTPAAPPRLARAQFKAALWTDASAPVHGLILGERVPGLAQRLREAAGMCAIGDHDCLLPGALAPREQAGAPWLVRLKPASPFTDWLLFDAATAHGEWGVLARCPNPFLTLRGHARTLMRPRLPDGTTIRLDWMDPATLAALLPLLGVSQLAQFFGPMTSLVAPGVRTDAAQDGDAAPWVEYAPRLGRLTVERSSVAAD